MSGRLLMSLMLGFTLIFGAALWYFQTYAYYYPVTLQETPTVAAPAEVAKLQDVATPAPSEPVAGTATPAKLPDNTAIAMVPKSDLNTPEAKALSHAITLHLTRVMDHQPEILRATGFQGIDADTSPLKFRACFTTTKSIPMLTETYQVYDAATPLKAPGWFKCFDNEQLADDLTSGEAIAFLGQANIHYGVDRVIAIYGDGRSYAWNQINTCGEAAFAGDPLPANCPPIPER